MPSNEILDRISQSIEDLSRYATTLAEYYIIDSPAVCLDKMDQTFVRVGRHKVGKTLLYSTKGGIEELLTAAPIHAKISFMEIFEKFFEVYTVHASDFWDGVDRTSLKCKDCVSIAKAAVKKMEEELREAKKR